MYNPVSNDHVYIATILGGRHAVFNRSVVQDTTVMWANVVYEVCGEFYYIIDGE